MLQWLRGRLNAETGPRDGEAPVLERLAVADTAVAPDTPAARPAPADHRDLRRDAVLGPLAQKVLSFHLANRFQTAYPLVLDFGAMEPATARLLMEVAAAALLADPRGSLQHEALRVRLAEAGAGGDALAALDAGMAAPRALSLLLPQVMEADVAAHAYAVTLIAGGRPRATGRHHLAYVAARLDLGQEMVASLNRRFQR